MVSSSRWMARRALNGASCPWSLLREALRAHALGPGGELLVIECRDTHAEDAAVRGRAHGLSLGAGYGVIVELRDDTKDVFVVRAHRPARRASGCPPADALFDLDRRRAANLISSRPWQAASVLGWMMPCDVPLSTTTGRQSRLSTSGKTCARAVAAHRCDGVSIRPFSGGQIASPRDEVDAGVMSVFPVVAGQSCRSQPRRTGPFTSVRREEHLRQPLEQAPLLRVSGAICAYSAAGGTACLSN